MRRATRLLSLLAAAASLLVAAPAAVQAAEGIVPVEGVWGARTSNDYPVSFEVRGGQVVDLKAYGRWGFCEEFVIEPPSPLTPDAAGHWTFTEGWAGYAEGTFTAPDRLEGAVGAPSRQLPGCPKVRGTFVAKPGPVPPRLPVVIPNGRGGFGPHPSRIRISTGLSFSDLQWKHVDRFGTRGDGVAHRSFGGRRLAIPAKVSLTRPVSDGTHWSFERLHYRLEGKLPKGLQREGWPHL